jgi:hypothetical protein
MITGRRKISRLVDKFTVCLKKYQAIETYPVLN